MPARWSAESTPSCNNTARTPKKKVPTGSPEEKRKLPPSQGMKMGPIYKHPQRQEKTLGNPEGFWTYTSVFIQTNPSTVRTRCTVQISKNIYFPNVLLRKKKKKVAWRWTSEQIKKKPKKHERWGWGGSRKGPLDHGGQLRLSLLQGGAKSSSLGTKTSTGNRNHQWQGGKP